MNVAGTIRWGITVVAVAALCAVITLPTYAATIYDDAISYWSAEGSALDEQGVNNGTIVGNVTYATGKVGQAFNIVEGSYINAGKGSTLTDIPVKTISAWICPTEQNWGQIASKGYWTEYLTYPELNNMRYYQGFTGNAGWWETASNTIMPNNWYHVVVEYNSTSTANDPVIYINNQQKTLTEGSTPSGTVNSDVAYNFIIGSDTVNELKGLIDEVAVWNRTLSAAEVDAIYKTSYVSSGINTTFGLGYTTDEINQLSYLYEQQAGSVDIGEMNWKYVATTPGTHNIGDAYIDSGKYYIKLGSGLEGTPIPEPSTVVGLLLATAAVLERRRSWMRRNA